MKFISSCVIAKSEATKQSFLKDCHALKAGLTIILLFLASFIFTGTAAAQSTNSLAGWWKFDEATSGTCSGAVILDSSGKGNTGTCSTAPSTSPTWTTGEIGEALQFDGVSSNVKIPNGLVSQYPYTISFWFKRGGLTTTGFPMVIKNASGSVNTTFIAYKSGAMGFYVFSGGTYPSTIITNTGFDDNTWHLMVAVAESATSRLVYMDGVNSPYTSTLDVGSGISYSEMDIGNGSNGVPITFDDIRVYNGALSPTDIANLYTTATGVAPASPTSPTSPTSPSVPSTPGPVVSNGSPTSALSAGTTSTKLSVATNEPATCKYSTTALTAYSSMTNIFSSDTMTPGTQHSTAISNLQTGQPYIYYVRCSDTSGNVDTQDYAIYFSVENSFTLPSGATIIGNDSLVGLPHNALWSRMINFQPVNGATVTLNPPFFSWYYTPSLPPSTSDVTERQFQFQASYSPTIATDPISSMVINVQTTSNMYNTVAPFNPGSTVYWRVGYITPSVSSTPYAWSVVRSFTIATVCAAGQVSKAATPCTTDWDRSMLANSSYMASKGGHPHILFNSTNLPGLQTAWAAAGVDWAVHQNPAFPLARSYNYIVGSVQSPGIANAAITSTWWQNPQPFGLVNGTWPAASTQIPQMEMVALAYQLSGAGGTNSNNIYLANGNTQKALVVLAQDYVNTGYVYADQIGGQSIEALALAYDWLYDALSADQRNIILQAIALNCQWELRGDDWWRQELQQVPLLNNQITSVTIGSGGSNYTVGDVLNIKQAGASGAQVIVTNEANCSGFGVNCSGPGPVTAVSLKNPGSGYLYEYSNVAGYSALATTGGTGSGATIYIGTTDYWHPVYYGSFPNYTQLGIINDSAAKGGNGHPWANYNYAMYGALAIYNDLPVSLPSTWAVGLIADTQEFFNLGLNYMMAKGYPFAEGVEGLNVGLSYAENGINRMMPQAILFNSVFPELQLGTDPLFSGLADWFGRMSPVGFVAGNWGWGDIGWGKDTTWEGGNGLGLGNPIVDLTDDPVSYEHWQNQQLFQTGYVAPDPFDDIPEFLYFNSSRQQLVTSITNNPSIAQQSLSKVYSQGGWATSCSAAPNTPACFTNGVGFIFQARPRGDDMNHAHFSDLSYQIWAYGSTITDAGSGMSPYGETPMAQYSILVNGLGPAQAFLQDQPYFSRIIACKNADGCPSDNGDYVYVAADGTNAYPRTSFTPGGWLLPGQFVTDYTGAPLAAASLQKVRRHILFVHKKYFVIYDDLASNQPVTYTSLYHILENTLVPDFSNLTGAAFSYTSNLVGDFPYGPTNPPDVLPSWDGAPGNSKGRPAPQNVSVYVKHIEDPASIAVTDETGTSIAANPIYCVNLTTCENYYSDMADGTPVRAHALWFTTISPQTNFHFMTVIYPVKPGNPAPTISRIDDYTAIVAANDGTGTVDLISFNPATASANVAANSSVNNTIVVNLLDINPIPVVDDTLANAEPVASTTTTTFGTLLYGDVLGSGRVTIYDAELTAQYAIGLPVPGFIRAQAQVDGNSTVDIYDAYLIAEYSIGLINKFPVNN